MEKIFDTKQSEKTFQSIHLFNRVLVKKKNQEPCVKGSSLNFNFLVVTRKLLNIIF